MLNYWCIVLMLLSYISIIKSNNDTTLELINILDSFNNCNYNKMIRPSYGEEPVNVGLSMHIMDISSVSEAQMEFTSDMYFKQTWNDDRLTFNSTTLKQLMFGAEFIKNIWVPDAFFVNGKETDLHVTSNLYNDYLIRLYPNGDIFFSIRLTVVASCQMDLKRFPMDAQICTLQVESYSLPNEALRYFWQSDKAVTFEDGIALPNFKVLTESVSQESTFRNYSSGNFSHLTSGIMFVRSKSYYINQAYVPAIMVVMISWIPFWLIRDDNHARVALGVTTALTITTLMTSTNAAMPPISYTKSIDIYMEFCFAMVFLSLIQYAFVGHFNGKGYMKKKKNNISEQGDTKINNSVNRNGIKLCIKPVPSKIDLHSRWIFPLIFILFNLIYWLDYLL